MYEVSNTYNPYSASTIFRSVSGANSPYQQTVTSASQYGQPTYRIGQNRIITSTFQQPKLAEAPNFAIYKEGAQSPWDNTSEQTHTMRRVNGGGHMPDPYLTPVGDVPWGLVILFALFLAAFRTIRHRLYKN